MIQCSFCGGERKHRQILIAGPVDLYICDECVDLCHNIIAEKRQQPLTPQRALDLRIGETRTAIQSIEMATARINEQLRIALEDLESTARKVIRPRRISADNIQAFGLVWYPDDSEGSWYSTITDCSGDYIELTVEQSGPLVRAVLQSGYSEPLCSDWSSDSVASIVSVLVQAGVSDAAPCANFRPLLERALAASKAKAKASGGET